jgi:hypothetical protein
MAEAAAGGTLNRALSTVRGDFSLIASEVIVLFMHAGPDP